jgi:SAM-dependent methyltransferase
MPHVKPGEHPLASGPSFERVNSSRLPPIYDRIGTTYRQYRRADPRLAHQIHRALGKASRVVNIGAGTGSYEPAATIVAVEPSRRMLDQRPPDSAPGVQAVAEHLPFADGTFDAAMAIFTVHHWTDPRAGLAQARRVTAGPLVVLTWDAQYFADHFWLVRDYLPEVSQADRAIPALSQTARLLQPCRIEVVPVPHDCTDGFSAAYWRRPEMYLDPGARAAISNLALLDPAVQDRMAAALSSDLASGRWYERNAELLELDELDCGYRLIVTGDRSGDGSTVR